LTFRVEFYSQIDKNRRNAKNVPLILNEDEPPEPRQAPRTASETAAVPVKTEQNHLYYMFFGKLILSLKFIRFFSVDMYSSSLAVKISA